MVAAPTKIDLLRQRGVKIPNSQSIDIGEEVKTERISEGVTLHAGTKLFGAETYIGQGAVIGYEAPVTLEDCTIGPRVELKGGFFRQAAILSGARCGSGAHVREGTILEERASIAHTVGLKQTILFPYVTLGSLINFCDCLMAGGTSPRDHSEVGSSYIHFNYTPNQDKATPSLMGDVPRGVMLKQSPIFLGGQGGLVGPSRIAFGTVVAAGTIFRKDQLQPHRLVFEGTTRSGNMPFKPGGFRNLKRILVNNFIYIGNLTALDQWYRHIRSLFVGPDLPLELFVGLQRVLQAAIQERVQQLKKLCEKVAAEPADDSLQQAFVHSWARIEDQIQRHRKTTGGGNDFDAFVKCVESKIGELGKGYLTIINKLSPAETDAGVRWLNECIRQLLVQVDAELKELKSLQAFENE